MSKLAARGIVVVSINYRLGVFGFLAHPELSKESPLGISGNYAVLDQIEALKWIKSNIAAFGGDPAQVTIDGQSAGGLSVMYLLTSPLARGLFAKAIAQSAYMVSMPSLKGEQQTACLQRRVRHQDLATSCMHRSIAAIARDDPPISCPWLWAMTGYIPWATIDGHVFKEQMVDAFNRGDAGACALDGRLYPEAKSARLRILAPPVPDSAADYEKTIRERYLDLADDFLKIYPSTDMQESILGDDARRALFLDGGAAGEETNGHRRAGLSVHVGPSLIPRPTKRACTPSMPANCLMCSGPSTRRRRYGRKSKRRRTSCKFSAAMTDYWTSFVRTGKPAAAGAPAWPAYDTTEAYMHFAATPEASTHVLPGMYKLNEEVVCRREAEGLTPWGWNVGLSSPPLPPQSPSCK